MSQGKRPLFALAMAFCFIGVLLAGCGAKEEAAPPGYYTGPMKGKTIAPPAGGDNSAPKGKTSIDG